MRITDGDIFRILEIEPTYEEKEIKKAYAKLVKKYHPEEHPEKWKEIHEVYEKALGLAKKEQCLDRGVKTPEAVILASPAKEKTAEAVMMTRQSKEKPPETQKRPPETVMKTEKPEIALELSEESDEMEILFDNIEALSRQQQWQNEEEQKEEQKKALETAVTTLKQMAAKRRLNQKEWETFFGRADMQPVICTGEFLYALGECFTNKTIDTRMYDFLLEQLILIEQYRKDRNITADNAGVSDPLGYARGKIHSACKAQVRMRDLAAGTTALVKALSWLLVAALSVTGMYLRIVRHRGPTAEERQGQYEQSAEKLERDREIIEELQRINEQQEIIKEELSQSIELVGMGDTREKMITLYGEPDILQEDPENPDYEKAVYHLYGVDMTITLYIDVVMNVHYEISQDERKGE